MISRDTGDGFPEIVTASSGLWYTATSATALPDVVTTFTDGLGYAVSVEYESLSQTLGSHYQLSGGTPSPYVRRFAGSRYVVTEETHDNGLNSGDTTREFDHYYDTAYVDYSGRGWLSFNWHVVTDSDQGTNTATWFNQTWPYAGQVELYRLRRNSDDQIIREVDPSLNKVTWATTPNRHFVYSDSTTTKEWEVGGTYNGTQLRTVVDDPTYTTGSYDEVYVSSTTQTITDPSTAETWTTVTSFDRSTDSDDWCIGLPGLVTTTKTLPNSNYAVRKLRHYWDSNTCALTEMRDESEASTAKQLKTTITRDGYGNENVVTLDSVDGSATDRVTDTDYDSYGQYPTSVTLGTLGLQNTFTWDYVAGRKASATDPSGLATSWTYDAFGRVASETVPGRSSTISYVSYLGQWPAGLTAFYVRAQHSDGGDDYRFFDKLQREIGTQARLPWGDWRMQSQLYSATGQIATVSKPFVWGETEFTTSISYDLIGRVTQENAPISESTTSGAYTTTPTTATKSGSRILKTTRRRPFTTPPATSSR